MRRGRTPSLDPGTRRNPAGRFGRLLLRDCRRLPDGLQRRRCAQRLQPGDQAWKFALLEGGVKRVLVDGKSEPHAVEEGMHRPKQVW